MTHNSNQQTVPRMRRRLLEITHTQPRTQNAKQNVPIMGMHLIALANASRIESTPLLHIENGLFFFFFSSCIFFPFYRRLLKDSLLRNGFIKRKSCSFWSVTKLIANIAFNSFPYAHPNGIQYRVTFTFSFVRFSFVYFILK